MSNKELIKVSTGAVSDDLIKLSKQLVSTSKLEITNPAVQYIVENIENKQNVFLTGSGGVGKSYTVDLLQEYYPRNLVVAPTHQASSVVGGITIHKAFRLGIAKDMDELLALDDKVITSIQHKNKVSRTRAEIIYFKSARDLIEVTDILIFDEISMVSKQVFDLVIYRLNNWLKGRVMPIIVVGDMYQLPPVLVDKEAQYKLDILKYKASKNPKLQKDYDREVQRLIVKNMNSMCYHSENWDFTCLELGTIRRSTDKDYIEIQQLIRKGILNDKVWDFIEAHTVSSVNPAPKDAIRLYPTNKEVDDYNRLCQDVIPYPYQDFHSKAVAVDGKATKKEVKKWVDDELIVDLEFNIKKSAKVIFCATVEGQYFNGERGTVVAIRKDTIHIRKQPTKEQEKAGKKGTVVIVDKFRFTKTSYTTKNNKKSAYVSMECYQFPIRVAYAMTIHKVQGMTIKGAIVIDCQNIWNSKGLFYVAVSRVTDPNNLYIRNFKASVIAPRGDIKKFYRGLKKQGLYRLM